MQSENDNIYKVGGVTPLHRACFSGATSTVRLLLDHIITITKNNSNSNSSNNTISSILSLPGTIFNDYQTPLHKCASGSRYLVVQLLLDFILEHDDTPSACALTLLLAKDAFGRTPLDVAREKQQQQNIERQLVQHWDTIAGGCLVDGSQRCCPYTTDGLSVDLVDLSEGDINHCGPCGESLKCPLDNASCGDSDSMLICHFEGGGDIPNKDLCTPALVFPCLSR